MAHGSIIGSAHYSVSKMILLWLISPRFYSLGFFFSSSIYYIFVIIAQCSLIYKINRSRQHGDLYFTGTFGFGHSVRFLVYQFPLGVSFGLCVSTFGKTCGVSPSRINSILMSLFDFTVFICILLVSNCHKHFYFCIFARDETC